MERLHNQRRAREALANSSQPLDPMGIKRFLLDELRHLPWTMQLACHPGRKWIEKCFRERGCPFATVLDTNSLAAGLNRWHFCAVPILRGMP